MVESQRNSSQVNGNDIELPTKKKYTWQQVSEKNNEKEAWIIIRDKVYNVTEWLCKHPGGDKMILLHAGRECTYTFDSYHPFSDKPSKILEKYEVGSLTSKKEFAAYLPDSGFYKECRNRVATYFTKNQLDPKDVRPAMVRYMALYSTFLVSYLLMNGWLTSNMLVLLLSCVLFGCCEALLQLHILHDASHAAITKNHQIWELAGRATSDWINGASFTSWLNQHIAGHHIYTNVAGSDPDLPIDFQNDIRRITERQILKPIYAWQHIYLPPLYGLLALKYRIQDFTHTFFSRTNGPVRVNPLNLTEWTQLILSKLFWAFYRIWIPINILHTLYFWSTFLLAECVCGWYLTFNFQVSHVSPSCEYQCNDGDSNIREEWAISQIKSSVDYAHGSVLVAFLSGALNYQVTHHLFPSVSQYHLPYIAPIVLEVCKEYKIKYTVLPTFADAFKAHLTYLKLMGSSGKRVSIHMG